MNSSIIKRFTALSGILVSVMVLVVVIIGGEIQPGYNYLQDFISELNASGSLYPNLMGYLGFLPLGVVTFVFIWRLKLEIFSSRNTINSVTRVSAGLILISFMGLDWFITALAPCDQGCPSSGNISISQTIHNLSGLLTALCVPMGVYLLIKPLNELAFGSLVTVAAVLNILTNIVVFILIVSPVLTDFSGLLQRINLAFIYGYLALLSFVIYNRSFYQRAH